MLDPHFFTLYLIRHGESTLNATPDVIGQEPTTPLTDKGKRQAIWLAERFRDLHIDHAFSSDYVRAFDTAQLVIGSKCPITTHAALREYSAGDWIGKSRSATYNHYVKLTMGHQLNDFLPPNGESMHQVERRASQWLENNILYNKDMIQQAQQLDRLKQPPMNIMVFSHGMTIKCLLKHIMNFDSSMTWKLSIYNTSVSKLSFGTEGWRVHSINDTAHLHNKLFV